MMTANLHTIMLIAKLAPDTPHWLLILVTAMTLGISFGFLIWGVVLEIKLLRDYRNVEVSPKEKWRKAIILALLQTSMIPLLGLAQPIMSPQPGQFPGFPLICGGFWIAILPFAILYKKWRVETWLRLS